MDTTTGTVISMVFVTIVYLFVLFMRYRQKRGQHPPQAPIHIKVATVSYIAAMVLFGILLFTTEN